MMGTLRGSTITQRIMDEPPRHTDWHDAPDDEHIVIVVKVKRGRTFQSCAVKVSTMLLEAGAAESGSINDTIMQQVREAIAALPRRADAAAFNHLKAYEEAESIAMKLAGLKVSTVARGR